MRSYPILPWHEFASNLLTTFDLDPIYPMLTMAGLDEPTLKRWLLAYWCYYSAGTASYIAEQPDFYDAMRDGFAGADQYARGHERRHFRGASGWAAIDCLETFGSPERVVDYMIDGCTFQEIANRVMKFKLFGPWIAWKVADMADRVMCLDIDFSSANLYMYKDPVQGAALYLHGDWEAPITPNEVSFAVKDMLAKLTDYMAPPFLDRPLNVQESETIACKFKAHVKGSYPLLNDIREITHGLKAVSYSKLASHLLNYLPNGVAKYQ